MVLHFYRLKPYLSPCPEPPTSQDVPHGCQSEHHQANLMSGGGRAGSIGGNRIQLAHPVEGEAQRLHGGPWERSRTGGSQHLHRGHVQGLWGQARKRERDISYKVM